MLGAAFLSKSPPIRRRVAPATPAAADRRLIPSTIELPLYIREGVEAYMLRHPGNTFTTVVLAGLQALGIEVEDEDLVPERAMKKLRKRAVLVDDTPATLKPTTIRVPRYVRVRAEHYLLERPEMRFRHLVMAGFRKLGIKVQAEDMIAERQNVLAVAPGRRT